MNTTNLYLHSRHHVGAVDPRVFGGFLEHMGRAVYEGVYEPKSRHADGDGYGGEAAGLCAADTGVAAAAEFEGDLGDLGGLAGAGVAADDRHGVVAQGRGDRVLMDGDRQFGRVAQGGDGRSMVGRRHG